MNKLNKLNFFKNEKFKAFTAKHAELYKFIKWNLVGAIGVPVEIGSYYLFAYVFFKSMNASSVVIVKGYMEYDGLGFMWAFLLSTILGEAVGFVLNRKLTFAADANPAVSIFLHMCMVAFSLFATTWVGMEVLRISAGMGGDIAYYGELAARPISTFAATIWLYPLNRFVVHRKKKPKPEAQPEQEAQEAQA